LAGILIVKRLFICQCRKLLLLSVLFCLLACLVAPASGSESEIPDDPQPTDQLEFINAVASPFIEPDKTLEKSTKKNRVLMLDIGYEALLVRIHLIRAAQKSLLIQTLIWSNDEVGRLMMYELIQAAKRGVKVRVLIDHIASEKNLEIAAFLATVEPNLQIKIYNPVGAAIPKKKINPTLVEKIYSIATGFDQINQRMHNKLFIVDGMIGITGGRNYENAYFDQARGLNYKDRDILIMGSVVTGMSESFNKFWEFRHTYLLSDLQDVQISKKRGEIRNWSSRPGFRLHNLFGDIEEKASDYDSIRRIFTDKLREVEHAYFIADDPGKNNKKWFGRFKGAGRITYELASLVSKANKSIVIQTPYLVLSKPAIKLFRKLRTKHPDLAIKVVTNSLAATDSWFTYAASFKQKQLYLTELGFLIYETKPRPGDLQLFMPTYASLISRPLTPSEKEKYTPKSTMWDQLDEPLDFDNSSNDTHEANIPQAKDALQGEPYFCLHAKSMVIDDEISFIGSYNLDPRSENLNTEVGLVIRDKKIAALLKAAIEKDMDPRNSWVIAKRKIPLNLDEANSVLVWLSRIMPIDPWPIRYASAYELIEGRDIVPPGHESFYENYKSVGSFPEVTAERSDKIIGAVMFKTFGSFLYPLL